MKNVAILVGLLISLSAVAENTVNDHLFRFSDTLETVQVEDALGVDSEMAQHKWLLRMHYDYTYNPLTGKADKNDADEAISAISLGAAYLVNPKLLLSFDLPVALRIDGSNPKAENEFGDLRLRGKYRLTKDNAGINVALLPALTIGLKDDYAISNDFGASLKVAADKTLGKVKLFGNLGYLHHDDAQVLNGRSRRKVVEAAVGMFWAFHEKVGLNLEMIAQKGIDHDNELASPYIIRTGLRGKIGKARAFLGASYETARNSISEQEASLYAGLKFGLGSATPVAAAAVAATAPAVAEPSVEDIKKEISVKRDIEFLTNSSKINASSHAELDSAAEVIKKYEDQIGTVAINGYTDSRGRASYNKSLSQRRADSVRAYLISKGVSADKLVATGYGEENPLVSPEVTAEDRAANRRVVFQVEEVVTTK